jgi:hypothetical protein
MLAVATSGPLARKGRKNGNRTTLMNAADHSRPPGALRAHFLQTITCVIHKMWPISLLSFENITSRRR